MAPNKLDLEATRSYLSGFCPEIANVNGGVYGNICEFAIPASNVDASVLKAAITKGLKNEGVKVKFEKYSDHNGDEFTWSWPDGSKRVCMEAKFGRDVQIGMVFFNHE